MSQTTMLEVIGAVDEQVAQKVAIIKIERDREECAKALRLGTHQRGLQTAEVRARALNPHFQWDDYSI